MMPISKMYFGPGMFGWAVADAKATDGPRTIRWYQVGYDFGTIFLVKQYRAKAVASKL